MTRDASIRRAYFRYLTLFRKFVCQLTFFNIIRLIVGVIIISVYDSEYDYLSQ